MLHIFNTDVVTVCSKCFICSVFRCMKCFHVASCKCSIWMLYMFSHICCKCYVALKCFMLHVFHAVPRVRRHMGVMVAWHGRRGIGCGEPTDVARWGPQSGTRRSGVCLWGGANGWEQVVRMEAGQNEADKMNCELVVRRRRRHDSHVDMTNWRMRSRLCTYARKTVFR